MKKPNKRNIASATPRPDHNIEQAARKIGDHLVQVDAVHHVKDIAPKTRGPWNNEAEKVAWTDARTGYGCIIRRAAQGGHLCGYVGVGPDHPVFGFQASACRDLGIRVHGGISYAMECERHEQEHITRRYRQEERSVCHVVRVELPPIQHTTKGGRTVLEVKPHDDLWWIGFECNQPTDVIPDSQRQPQHALTPAGTVERAYRGEGYVFEQCVWLAEQLKAIEECRDPRQVQERWTPPAGSDPRHAGR